MTQLNTFLFLINTDQLGTGFKLFWHRALVIQHSLVKKFNTTTLGFVCSKSNEEPKMAEESGVLLKEKTITGGFRKEVLWQFTQGGGTLTWNQFLSLLESDDTFMNLWLSSFKKLGMDGYYFECPPVTNSLLGKPFECRFIEETDFKGERVDPGPFSKHLNNAAKGAAAVAFNNLGGD